VWGGSKAPGERVVHLEGKVNLRRGRRPRRGGGVRGKEGCVFEGGGSEKVLMGRVTQVKECRWEEETPRNK